MLKTYATLLAICLSMACFAPVVLSPLLNLTQLRMRTNAFPAAVYA